MAVIGLEKVQAPGQQNGHPAPLRREPDINSVSTVRGVPVVDLKQLTIDPTALRYIPENLARRHHALPVGFHGSALLVVMANPEDLGALEDLQAQAGVRVRAVLAPAEDVDEAINLSYKATSEIAREVKEYTNTTEHALHVSPLDDDDLRHTPVVRTLDLLLLQALRDRASDIHLDPQPSRLRIRYRIDGVLQDIVSLPMAIHAPLVSRVKIMAQMNIAEKRLPQDGQFSFKAPNNSDIDVRVATIETAYGERVVMRLLDKAASLPQLPDLGLLTDALASYQQMLQVHHGMILISGPTGAGKTTTLYASLNALDKQSKNIVTIEDPVEYRFLDISQIQVNLKAGLTFAEGLRALMRHDPDIIMVGEIRDPDTARTAVQAALTGPLVLSSIHANDTEGVMHRLRNLGVDPFLIANALVGVVAQRMVRRVCPKCAVQQEASAEEQQSFAAVLGTTQTRFSYGAGCQFCAATGFRGRTGLFEVMTVTDRIRQLILNSHEPGSIRRQAMQEGSKSLLHDGLLKAAQGVTTPMEVLRNLYAIG